MQQRKLLQNCKIFSKNNVAYRSFRRYFNDDPDLPKEVVTGGESFVYGFDIETKAQLPQWMRPEEPRP